MTNTRTRRAPRDSEPVRLGASQHPDVDAARRTLANRLDSPGSPREARERDHAAYVAALKATGLRLARIASVDEMVAAMKSARRG